MGGNDGGGVVVRRVGGCGECDAMVIYGCGHPCGGITSYYRV